MNCKVMKLSAEDVDLAKKLFAFFQRDDDIENPSFASDEYLEKLLKRKDFHVIVALEQGKPLGGLTAYELRKYIREERRMFLYEIAVEYKFRRLGIGRKLIERLKEICREKNIRQMFVGALAENEPALKLYESTGGVGKKVLEFDYYL